MYLMIRSRGSIRPRLVLDSWSAARSRLTTSVSTLSLEHLPEHAQPGILGGRCPGVFSQRLAGSSRGEPGFQVLQVFMDWLSASSSSASTFSLTRWWTRQGPAYKEHPLHSRTSSSCMAFCSVYVPGHCHFSILSIAARNSGHR